MWEEPRPDRLSALEDSPRASPLGAFIAIAAIAGVGFLLWNKGVFEPLLRPAEEPPSVAPAPPAATPAGEDQRPAPAHVERPLRVPSGPTGTATTRRGDPSVLERLTETCHYWVTQNTRGQYSGNQQVACDDMARYAREFGMAVPYVPGGVARSSGSNPSSSSQRGIRVSVDECERHGYGSVDYRQCRAAEQRRLDNWCGSLRTNLESARGAQRDSLRARMDAVCLEARRYQIVN
jgi:hypothetical protein